jgi:hypothetical protein
MMTFGTAKCLLAQSALIPRMICQHKPSGVPVKRKKDIFSVILVSNSGGKLHF